jgi:hypothetical protein
MGQQGINDFIYPQLTSFNSENHHLNNITDSSNMSSTKFDIQQFNKNFKKKIEQSKEENKILERNRLERLNKQEIERKPYQLSVAEILIAIKDSWFGVIDDLLQRQFYIETFIKKNRMFYIGLTIVIIAIIIYLYDTFIDNSINYNNIDSSNIHTDSQKKIIEIRLV